VIKKNFDLWITISINIFPALIFDFPWQSYYISGNKILWEEFYKNSHLEMWIPFIYNISLRYKSHGFYRYAIWYILVITCSQTCRERYQILSEIKIKSKFWTQNQIILKWIERHSHLKNLIYIKSFPPLNRWPNRAI
jgi:hypothetical protein